MELSPKVFQNKDLGAGCGFCTVSEAMRTLVYRFTERRTGLQVRSFVIFDYCGKCTEWEEITRKLSRKNIVNGMKWMARGLRKTGIDIG